MWLFANPWIEIGAGILVVVLVVSWCIAAAGRPASRHPALRSAPIGTRAGQSRPSARARSSSDTAIEAPAGLAAG